MEPEPPTSASPPVSPGSESSSEPAAAGGPTLWCLGLQRTSSRPLAADEKAWVTRLAQDSLISLWKPTAFFFCAHLTLFLGTLSLETQDREGGSAFAILGLALLAAAVVLLGAGLMRLVVTLRRWRRLRQDLLRGEADCFGEVEPAVAATAGARSAEALPRSQALLSVNGRPIRRWLAVPIAEATAPPAAPVRLAVPKTLADKLDPSLSVERRRLSAGELDELARHIGRLKAPSGTLVLLIALTALGLGLALSAGESFDKMVPRDVAYAALVAVALGLNTWVYVRARRLANRLERDQKDEWVVIVAKETASHSLAGGSAQPLVVEMLPASGVVWTENGQPGGWRLSEGRRPRLRWLGRRAS